MNSEMPRTCIICTHAQRTEVDQLLVSGNGSIRSIAHQFRVTRDSLQRHKAHHLTKRLGSAAHRRESQDDDLLSRIEQPYDRAERLYAVAEGVLERCEKDPNMTLKLALSWSSPGNGVNCSQS